jgi:hypothetical protein
MENALRTLVLFALAGAAVSAGAWFVAWRLDPRRRLRRAMRRVIAREPDAEAISATQGRAIGLDLEGAGLVILWDVGASGLVFGFDEIEGAELIVDGEVKASVRRGEPVRALDRLDPLVDSVCLRLMFDTPRWPEFELDLNETPGAGEEALREGRRWLAQLGTVLRRADRKRARAEAAAQATSA